MFFWKKCESQAVKSHNGCCTIKITKKQLYHKKNQYSFRATFRLLYFVPHFAILPVFSMQKGWDLLWSTSVNIYEMCRSEDTVVAQDLSYVMPSWFLQFVQCHVLYCTNNNLGMRAFASSLVSGQRLASVANSNLCNFFWTSKLQQITI